MYRIRINIKNISSQKSPIKRTKIALTLLAFMFINAKMAERFRKGWEGSVAALGSTIEGIKLTGFDIIGRSAVTMLQLVTGAMQGFHEAFKWVAPLFQSVVGIMSVSTTAMINYAKSVYGLALMFDTLSDVI